MPTFHSPAAFSGQLLHHEMPVTHETHITAPVRHASAVLPCKLVPTFDVVPDDNNSNVRRQKGCIPAVTQLLSYTSSNDRVAMPHSGFQLRHPTSMYSLPPIDAFAAAANDLHAMEQSYGVDLEPSSSTSMPDDVIVLIRTINELNVKDMSLYSSGATGCSLYSRSHDSQDTPDMIPPSFIGHSSHPHYLHADDSMVMPASDEGSLCPVPPWSSSAMVRLAPQAGTAAGNAARAAALGTSGLVAAPAAQLQVSAVHCGPTALVIIIGRPPVEEDPAVSQSA